jgi:dUTPase
MRVASKENHFVRTKFCPPAIEKDPDWGLVKQYLPLLKSIVNKVLANTPPTGDEIYTGEYKLVFYHVMKDLPRYKVGDKIAQLHLDFTFPANFIEVNQLDITERGEDGFGSTDLEVQENNE